MPLCAPSDFLLRYDARVVGELVSDANTRVAAVDLATNDVVLTALADAEADLQTALLTGGRYSADDLSGLSGSSLTKAKRVISDIAIEYLKERRGNRDPERAKVERENALAPLDRLRRGENVFNLTPQIEAGNADVDGPTTLEFQDLNLVRDRVGDRYYPGRVLPHNR